jgi:hypothetical protein
VTTVNAEKLLAYAGEMKRAAAVAGHQGTEKDDYHMGRAFAYQDIENILIMKIRGNERNGVTP